MVLLLYWVTLASPSLFNTKNSAKERMKKLSNLGGYQRLTLFVIHTFTCNHLEDEERD